MTHVYHDIITLLVFLDWYLQFVLFTICIYHKSTMPCTIYWTFLAISLMQFVLCFCGIISATMLNQCKSMQVLNRIYRVSYFLWCLLFSVISAYFFPALIGEMYYASRKKMSSLIPWLILAIGKCIWGWFGLNLLGWINLITSLVFCKI